MINDIETRRERWFDLAYERYHKLNDEEKDHDDD